MHPALRKGPLFTTPPIFHFFYNKKHLPPIFHFSTKQPPFFYFFYKKHPPILFPAYGPCCLYTCETELAARWR